MHFFGKLLDDILSHGKLVQDLTFRLSANIWVFNDNPHLTLSESDEFDSFSRLRSCEPQVERPPILDVWYVCLASKTIPPSCDQCWKTLLILNNLWHAGNWRSAGRGFWVLGCAGSSWCMNSKLSRGETQGSGTFSPQEPVLADINDSIGEIGDFDADVDWMGQLWFSSCFHSHGNVKLWNWRHYISRFFLFLRACSLRIAWARLPPGARRYGKEASNAVTLFVRCGVSR